jgi:uncharacterized protein YqeY
MTEGSILDRLQGDLAAAMKAQDKDTLSTLRMLKSALMEMKTKKPKDALLTPEEEIETLQRYVKKRRETIEELKKVGRAELVAREEREIEVTQRYLPQGLSEDELKDVVRGAIARTGASGPRDIGKVIGAVMGEVKGRAEGSVVSRMVKELLGGA